MEFRGLAVHRTIAVLDVEGFGAPHRTNRNQVAIRDGLYSAVQEGLREAGIPWADGDHEDRGDGMLILVGPGVPKSLFVESLPSALAAALRRHNSKHPETERIRLRMALHAGEIYYDEHGATAAAINLTFRLLESDPVKQALAGSAGVLAIITSSWFFEEVVRDSTADAAVYRSFLYRSRRPSRLDGSTSQMTGTVPLRQTWKSWLSGQGRPKMVGRWSRFRLARSLSECGTGMGRPWAAGTGVRCGSVGY